MNTFEEMTDMLHVRSKLHSRYGNSVSWQILCVTNALADKQLDFIRFFIKMSQLLFIKHFYFFKTFQKTNNIFVQQCLEK
jgi:hypothetical protein